MYAIYSVFRDKAGYTDYKVAKMCEIPPTAIYDWKNNLYTPKADKMKKIAGLLGISVDILIQ